MHFCKLHICKFVFVHLCICVLSISTSVHPWIITRRKTWDFMQPKPSMCQVRDYKESPVQIFPRKVLRVITACSSMSVSHVELIHNYRSPWSIAPSLTTSPMLYKLSIQNVRSSVRSSLLNLSPSIRPLVHHMCMILHVKTSNTTVNKRSWPSIHISWCNFIEPCIWLSAL